MAHRAVVCRPEETCFKNSGRTSEILTYRCACLIRRRCLCKGGCFQVHPCSGAHLLLARCLAGVMCFLADCTPAACKRSPTKRATRFLRACFMVFPLSTSPVRCTLDHSTGPLSRGMAEWNSPLKTLQDHDLAGTERQYMLWWTHDWQPSQQRQWAGSDSHHIGLMRSLGCMDIHLGQAEDTVLMYCLQKNLRYRPQGLADGNLALETLGCCRRQYPPIHWQPLLRWGQLEGILLALPDGYECVATGGPQVVFVLSIVLLPLPCSSAELGVLKLTTVVTVKQATMELEHRGSVRMIAIHG